MEQSKQKVATKVYQISDAFQWSNLNIPNLITLGALFTGFWAISLLWTNRVDLACTAIVFAAMFDYLDGRIARMAKLETKFGSQIDSLADIVSFGIAPAAIFLYWNLQSGIPVPLLLLASFFYIAATTFRLAHFNVMMDGDKPSTSYAGLPSPTAAMLMIGFVWNANSGIFANLGISVNIANCLITLMASYLMISPIRFSTVAMLRSKEARKGAPIKAILLFSFAFTLLITHMQIGVLILSVGYISYGFYISLCGLMKKNKSPNSKSNGKLSDATINPNEKSP